MSMALSAKDKFGFIDGSLTKPAMDTPKYFAWDRCNNMVLSWILNSVSQEISSSIIYIESTKRCGMTSKRNSLNQMDLKFFSCRRSFLFFLRITNL
jgi:hypothetical protein